MAPQNEKNGLGPLAVGADFAAASFEPVGAADLETGRANIDRGLGLGAAPDVVSGFFDDDGLESNDNKVNPLVSA